MSWLVRVIGLCILAFSMLNGLSSFANAQHGIFDCQPERETFSERLHGKVKEIRATNSNPGSRTEFIDVQKFDEFGKRTEAEEGIREEGATEIKWRSRSAYAYDELARLMSITELLLFNPPVQLECVLGYSNFGDLALVVRSDAKSFTGASLYVHESGKLVKKINYYQGSMLPAGISTFEYDTDMRTTEQRNIGDSRYSKSTHNERGEKVKFEAYEKNTLVAHETFTYSERGALIENAHYRPGDVLVWRDLFRYEYDQVGNWTSRDYSQTSEKDSEVGATRSRTIRAITYYSP